MLPVMMIIHESHDGFPSVCSESFSPASRHVCESRMRRMQRNKACASSTLFKEQKRNITSDALQQLLKQKSHRFFLHFDAPTVQQKVYIIIYILTYVNVSTLDNQPSPKLHFNLARVAQRNLSQVASSSQSPSFKMHFKSFSTHFRRS